MLPDLRLAATAAVSALALSLVAGGAAAADDPLPSWNDGEAKRAILSFTAAVTEEGGDAFVPEAERIAVFDNDGTLWTEAPIYSQLIFAVDRVKALAPQHPEWETTEPFASILKDDLEGALAGGHESLAEIIAATHAGLTTEQFAAVVADWLETARHPVTGRPYTETVYQPMLEVLDHLRANGFRTYIVSGGGIDLIRVFSEAVYGIPPEQVVGSSLKMEFDIVDGAPVLLKRAEVDFIDDGAGKPVGIERHIGRRPIAAFGNSDGDLQMLQYTCLSPGPNLCVFVHHTDAEREAAYDRDSAVGRLDAGLDAAAEHGWTLADMKRDWRTVYPD